MGLASRQRLLRLGRRPLPFVMMDAAQLSLGEVSVKQVDTTEGLGLLAEVMRQALVQGLLP